MPAAAKRAQCPGLLLALLALLLASFPDALHRDGLHAQRAGAVESVSSGCAEQHPPRFERLLASHQSDCPGCLLQLQHRGAPLAATALAVPSPRFRATTAPAVVSPLGSLLRFIPPRGPPAA
jgi:hypothetical protein